MSGIEKPVGQRTTTEATQAGLDHFQGKVGAWGTRTFPKSYRVSKARHLLREAGEVLVEAATLEEAEAWGKDSDGYRLRLAEECADVFLILLHIAHAEGFSLAAAARQKFTEVQTRQWGAPDATGVVEHVRKVEESRKPGKLSGVFCHECRQREACESMMDCDRYSRGEDTHWG